MCFFKKKPQSDLNQQDRDQIAVNSKMIDVLTTICKDEEFIPELEKLKEQITFLQPSPNHKVYEADKKIKNRIDDLKIALVKGNAKSDDVSEKAENIFEDIRMMIAERNVLV